MTSNPWPELPLAEWKDTFETLHMWTQIVGKIRLKLTPLENHWWNVTLYVTPRGLTTSIMSYKGQHFQIDFDFIDHQLLIETTHGSCKPVVLRPMSVAEFYQETMTALESLGISVNIWTTPTEVSDRIPFEQDRKHASYDPEYANRFWRILVESTRVLKGISFPFHRKGQSDTFFLGRIRSGCHALFRTSSACAPRHSIRGPFCRCGSLFSRSKQLRFLARRRSGRTTGILCLCLPGASGL